MVEGYVYKILFEDGCWYWGTSEYKGTSPEKDGYYGSPVTHKSKWNEPHSKIVVKLFYDENSRLDYERMCILPDLDNPKCLNEHAVKSFSKEVCKKGGSISAEKSRGVPRLQDTKDKISQKLSGRKLSSDHVQKLKEAVRPPIAPETIAKRVESRKGYRHSEETILKLRKSAEGREVAQETRDKIAASVQGYKWYNNGTQSVQAYSHPGEGWQEGRIFDWDSPRSKGMKWYHKNGQRKMFKEDPGDGWVKGILRPKGKSYYNNGTEHVLAHKCPGEGWVLGRLKKR